MNKQVFGQIKCFERGDYVKVSWFDVSDVRGFLVGLVLVVERFFCLYVVNCCLLKFTLRGVVVLELNEG